MTLISCVNLNNFPQMTLTGQEKPRVMKDTDLHQPVLVSEVIEYLQPQSTGLYIDATFGLGGHARSILSASAPEGKLLGIDRDYGALDQGAQRLLEYEGRYNLEHGNFADLETIAQLKEFKCCHGILADLGVSSYQLDDPQRGFSFQKVGPLDMRMDVTSSLKVGDVINRYSETDLASLIYTYGEEPESRRIAKAIVRARPFVDTRGLAEVVSGAIRFGRRRKIHPATRTFQALRIFVNNELEALQQFIESAVELLRKGGRLVVISFHSLEDRIVKNMLDSIARGCICPPKFPCCVCGQISRVKVLTRKPISPREVERIKNPRSRSAKLRVAERL